MLPSERVRLAVGPDDSLEQLQSIFEHLADGVFLVKVLPGPDFAFEAFNRQTAEWVGISSEAVRGRRLREVLPPSEAERIAEIYARCAATGKTQRYEEMPTAIQPDMCFQTTLIPVSDELGTVKRIVGVSRDISDQKRAARELLESQEMFAKAFRHGPYAMLIVRLSDGLYVDVNAAFERLFECDREEVIGNRSATLSIWPDPGERQRMVEQLRAGGVRDFAARLRSFKGNDRDVLLSSDEVVLGGQPHIIATVRDVTRQLDSERTRAELEAQLRQAQKLEALGTLAGGIAHDFNNILGAMVAFIDLIRIDVNDRMSVLDHVDELKSASHRARDLVQQILTFSRTQKPSRSITKVDQAVRDALKLLRSSLPSSVVIQSSFDADAPAGVGRPFTASPSGDESGHQRGSRHARARWGAHAARGAVRGRRRARSPSPRLAAGPLRPHRRQGLGPGHGRGDAEANFRTVLHHQKAGRRHRSGTGGGAWHRARPRRRHRGRKPRRRRHERRSILARAPR